MADESGLDPDNRGQVDSRASETRIACLAGNQYGRISRAQLLAEGLSRGQIERRIASRRLTPVLRGVYALGPKIPSLPAACMAATLFAGSESLLSHRPAGAHWGLSAWEGGSIDITCSRHVRAPRGVRSHRCTVPPDERTSRFNIPLTSTGRTILDCAADSRSREIERMLNKAFMLGLPIKPPLAVLLDRYPGRRGAIAARAALTAFEGGRTPTKSDLEELFVDFLDRHGFPRPHTNHDIETHIGVLNVDLCWPVERVVIEVDAPSTHGSRPVMLSDRRRDRALALAGWTPGRVMDEDLDDEPGLAEEIRRLLGA